jgi:DNA-binding NarL/FixJ family response regulator
MRNLRIFIAEPDRDLRLGLQMLLDPKPGMRVVGIAVRPAGLMQQVKAVKPDIVILDWQLVTAMPEGTIRKLKSVKSRPLIIVLHIRSESYVDAEAAGADYIFCKNIPPDQLVAFLNEKKRERSTKDTLQKDE